MSLGISYYQTGTDYVWEREGYNSNFTEHEKFRFKRVALPFAFGYDFRIKKLPLSFFLATRTLYNIAGSYEYVKSGSDISTYKKKIDPYDYQNLDVGAARFQRQYCAGLSVNASKNIVISVIYANNYNGIFFQEQVPPWQPSATGYVHFYTRPDMMLSVKYILFSSKEKNN